MARLLFQLLFAHEASCLLKMVAFARDPIFELVGGVQKGVWLMPQEGHILFVERGNIFKHHLSTGNEAAAQKFIQVRPSYRGLQNLVFCSLILFDKRRVYYLLPQLLQMCLEKDEHFVNGLNDLH